MRLGDLIGAAHIGGAAPSRPTLMAGAVIVPSDCLVPATMKNCAPGLRSSLLPALKRTTGVLGGTTTFFSPSLYLTVRVWPSTASTLVATSALVMVLPGSRSHGVKFAGTTPRWASMKI